MLLDGQQRPYNSPKAVRYSARELLNLLTVGDVLSFFDQIKSEREL
jgi:hypothetical protein